jgi:hypothetical protein
MTGSSTSVTALASVRGVLLLILVKDRLNESDRFPFPSSSTGFLVGLEVGRSTGSTADALMTDCLVVLADGSVFIATGKRMMSRSRRLIGSDVLCYFKC